MGQKEDPIRILECALARQVDNEIACLGRQRNAGVRIIELDQVGQHANLSQRANNLLPDQRFPSRHALNGKKAHETAYSGVHIDSSHEVSSLWPTKSQDNFDEPTRSRARTMVEWPT